MKPVSITAALIFCISIISVKAKAQAPHIALYVHALYATAIDNSSQKLYNGGAGAEAGILAGPKNTMFAGSVGYSRFFAENVNEFGDETYIPVKVGVRQYLPVPVHFLFVQGDAGIGFVSSKNPGNDGSRFAFDFGAGLKFTAFEAALVWDNFHEVHPEGWSSWFTIKAGINLGF
jgi:Outer membrane protein beta-barrel domain